VKLPQSVYTIIHTTSCPSGSRSRSQAIPFWRKQTIANGYRVFLCKKKDGTMRSCRVYRYWQPWPMDSAAPKVSW